MMSRPFPGFFPALALFVLWASPAAALGTRDAAALAAMKALAGSDSGLVVWHSRRTGPMRIFTCGLDGANLRQLTPDVTGKDHIAPMISPSGKKVIYYETATLTESTYYDDHVGQMMIVDAQDTKGTTAKMLLSEVRTFFECRFARWIDDDTIAYIGKDHHGYTYSISKNTSTKLFDYPLADFGAIPNRQLTWAIDGNNRVFELNAGTATQKQDFNGCEGNMSHDGLYAYRVEGSSHDFTRMKLGSWTEDAFFANHSTALPSTQNYIYFPQISPDQHYLVFSASPNQHNHFTSDYDIYVVPMDPVTFKNTASAVQFSFDGALDAYPDIWIAPQTPTLTTLTVTVTNSVLMPKDTVQLTAVLKDQLGSPIKGVVSWSVSGGGTLTPSSSGAAVTQCTTLFTSDGTAGSFTVSATADQVSGSATLQVVDLTFPLRINCGDNDHDVTGWTRDDAFVSGGADYVNANTTDTTGVQNVAPVEVYKSMRHQTPHSYLLPVPDGKYTLRLHFSDPYGERSMNYTVEGVQVLKDFDVVTLAGGVDRAWVEELAVTVSDGNGLTIEASGVDDVFEAGLELLVVSIDKPPLPEAGPTPADGGIADAGVDDSAAGHGQSGLGGGCAAALGTPVWPGLALLLLLGLGVLRRAVQKPR